MNRFPLYSHPDEFFTALIAAGMPEVPQAFSVVPLPHLIPHSTIIEIDAFLRIFERVTTSALWRQVVATSAPEIAQAHRVPQWIK